MRLEAALLSQREAAVPQRALVIHDDPTLEFREVLELRSHALVDLADADAGVLGRDPAVKKQRPVDADHGVVLADPFPVLARGTERAPVLGKAEGMLGVPLLAIVADDALLLPVKFVARLLGARIPDRGLLSG